MNRMKVWLLDVMILFILFIRVGQAQVKTKPVLTVHPNVSPLIRGQMVSLTCTVLEESGSYHWYEDGDSFLTSTTNYYRLKVDQSHSYSCYKSEDGQSTIVSNEVTLSVIEQPKAVLSVQPEEEIFTGEKVTFKCKIPQDPDNKWIYNWYKDGVQFFASVEKNEFSFTPEQTFSSKYTCSGERKVDSQRSKNSTVVTLTVSETPKPKLTSNHEGVVLTGNYITLTCKLTLGSAGWRFYWFKPKDTEDETETKYNTIYIVDISDGGQYKCRAGRGNPVYYTDYSDALWVKVTESPKPVLTVKPDKNVFSGETVTFRCKIPGEEEWKYSWYNGLNRLHPVSTTQEISLSPVSIKDSGKYICIGLRSGDRQTSETSDIVTLNVSDMPETVVTVSPLSWLNEGDSVTLSCKVKHSSTGWTFNWYIDFLYRTSLGSLEYRTELLSDSSRGSGGSYTLSPVTLSHTGVYLCRAARGEQVFHTKYSNQQILWITGKSPPMSLIINPSRTQHFTAKSFTLSCKDQSESTGWTVRGYTQSEALWDCSSVLEGSCNIKVLYSSHTGVYWCQSEYGGRSNPVNITVHDGQVILDSPVHPVTEGHSLTLRCLYNLQTTSESGIDFYKDGAILQNNTAGEMTISKVSKSHKGFYYCKHPRKGESPKSWVFVSLQILGPRPNFVIVAVAVGLSLVLLLIIISVFLLWRHKSNKGKDRGQQQKSNQPQGLSQSGAEESRTGDTPLQTDVAEPSNVTYAELELKPQNKAKKVKADTGSGTIYSVLKQNT